MGRKGKVWLAGAVCAVAAAAVAGCDPADGLGASAVSVTTDQLATHELKHDGVKVQWLSCSATTGTRSAKVDCLGRTDDQRKITVKGTVTEQRDDTCVRGRLVAVAGGRTVFDVGGLGDCVRHSSPGRS
ncbi:hypothetical protein [Actinacidiphila rubida]|uniref:Lipoprotein n=1 Tax=Actinacidiphila rubida TaxID=310780 RepID=A0A1H8F516_9ACTN|nr:hypothetical protein [Actinacidiphila rubida]SEN26696.1 hypothetical protein SAMN05216267_1003134 [Actinacidiphila rubida]